ncbi:MAG: 4'-phosphopantetheinyl transferase superfamily protein [Bacteroidaceae bacterium]|nr:4'-phosphopantetheinyl transferase superfamily protein [Bacteroidaceae bacterium]
MMILIDDQINDYTAEQITLWTDELPLWRREQVLSHKHDTGRRQSLLAYRLLCQGLREQYGISEPPTFTYNEHGKPHLSPLNSRPSPFFSLSHCRTAVACVIDERPCGIDIEAADRRVSDAVIRYSMSEAEQALIQQSPDPGRTFLRLWTQKEAVLKLLGTGIRDDMRDILSAQPYSIEQRENERYVLSVAW